MGMTIGNGRRGLVADINVTPLVDVMLVLLIIFMVTAPMMTQGMDVDLPETTAKSLPQKPEPLVITVDKDGQIFIDRIKVAPGLMKQELSQVVTRDKDRQVLLKADKTVAYGLVAKVMADAKEAGVDKLGMVTLPQEERP
ncbi:MAG: protein TolR [Thermodesulfobacteriota bacterium]